MQETIKKEDISINYISVLCAYADVAYEIIRHDDDSTDGILRKTIELGNNQKFISELRIQLKCTSSVSQYIDNGDTITYKLKVKNYNDLCTPSTTPIILGLLILPPEKNEWVKWSPEELLIKGCMYWNEFSNNTSSKNTGTINVKFDKKNVVNSETLCDMLEKIAREGSL